MASKGDVASPKMLRQLLDVAADGVVVADDARRIILFNQAAATMFGYAPAEVIGQDIDVLLPLAARPHHAAHMRAFGDGPTTSRAMGERRQLNGRRKDGTEFPVEVGIAHFTEGGRPHYIATVRDVSERAAHQAEMLRLHQQLQRREAEARQTLDHLLETMPEGFHITDAAGTVQAANAATIATLGVSRDEIIGAPLSRFVLEREPGAIDAMLAQIVNGGVVRSRCMVRRGDGTTRLIEYTAGAMQSDGEPRILTTFRDITERAEIERRVRDSEERLRATLASMDDLVFTIGPEGHFDGWHQPLRDNALYRPPDFFIGKHVRDVLPLTVAAHVMRAFEQIAESGGTQRIDYDLPLPDGLHSYNALLSPRRSVTGGFDGVTAVVRDITESERMRRELTQTRDALQGFLDNAHDLVQSIDAKGHFTYVNRAWCETLGYTVLEAMALTLFDVIAPSSQDHCRALLAQAADVGQQKVSLQMRARDGRILQVEGSIRFTVDDDGRLVETRGIFHDLTERMAIEEALRQSDERFRRSQVFANIGTWDWNIGTGGLYWSERIAPLFGGPAGRMETTYEAFLAAVHPDDRQYVIDSVNACVHRGVDYDIEHRVVWQDGTVRWLHEAGDVTRDANGTPLHMLGVVQDVTRRKLAEDALRIRTRELAEANGMLERASQLKDDFLASMSHELRTPLTGILGLTEALREGVYGDVEESQQASLGLIEQSGQHLLALINDILDLSKIEAGKLELGYEECSASELARESLELVKGMAQKKGLQVELSIVPALLTFVVDPRRVKQMLVNLLGNAVKFTSSGKRIGLTIREDTVTDTIHFEVWDEGVGIAAEDQQSLFQPFRQVDRSLSRQHAGTGLGLALVRRLVELHGGGVSVESAVGVGSQFRCVLPKRPPHEVLATAQRTERWRRPRISQVRVWRALTIEDDAVDAERLTRLLEQLNVENVVSADGKGIFELIAAEQPAFVLLDLALPGHSGWDVLEALRTDARTRDLPIVVVSNTHEPERARQLGAAGYLAKPFRLSELEAIVQELQASPGLLTGEHPVPEGQMVSIPDTAQRRPLVLVADDNDTNRQLLRDYLRVHGCEVHGVQNGVEAVRATEELHPAVILMDVQMPVLDGLTATRRIRQHADASIAQTPIIVLTALAMQGDRERCLAAGANDYVSKPIDLRRLLEKVQAFVAGGTP